MFNCGILAIELKKDRIDELFDMDGNTFLSIDPEKCELSTAFDSVSQHTLSFQFDLNEFDKKIVSEDGWLAYADSNY